MTAGLKLTTKLKPASTKVMITLCIFRHLNAPTTFSIRVNKISTIFSDYIEARLHAGVLQYKAGGSNKAKIKEVERHYADYRELWQRVRRRANELGFSVHRVFNAPPWEEQLMLLRLRTIRLIKKGTLEEIASALDQYEINQSEEQSHVSNHIIAPQLADVETGGSHEA